MKFENWTDWVAWAGLVLPLMVLAGSAALYVRSELIKSANDRYSRFWEVMRQAGQQDGNITAKMAAFYEMRSFPEYSEVIIRLCEGATVVGSEGELLRKEMLETARYLRAKSK